MDGGTKDITERYIYMCAFLLVGLTAIHSGNCALTQNSGEDIFTIRHVSSGQCLQADPQGVRVGACRGSPAEQWKWGWGNRLFHVDTARCLGLQPGAVTPTLLNCTSGGDTLSWLCEEEAVYVRSELYLSAANGTAVVQDKSRQGWTRGNSSESICHRPYKVMHTTKGNSFGAPCMFPFLYNGTWFHGCFPDDSGKNYTRCSTTSDYDTDGKWGICLNYEEGCGPLWSASDSGNCYQSNTEAQVSWHEARASCWSQGADLLSITSLEELALVNATDHPDLMWIGLNQLNMAQGWQWSDGSPLTLVNWNEGMTEVSALTESDCAVVTSEGRWEKTACDRKLPYLCEKAASRKQPENPWVLKATKCPEGWFAWNGFCYQMSKELLSQGDTVVRCGANQALLASIGSLAEVEAISTEFHNSTVGAFDVWIGLMNERSPPLFQWMDKTSVSFTYWARNEPAAPSDSHSTCVSYSGEFHQWKVTPCGNKLRYLCKKRGQDLGTVVRAGCPSDGDWVRHGNACYKVDTKPVLFKDRCDLTIMNRFEQAFISSLIREKSETQYYWTGLQDINNTGEYHWSTREIPVDRVTYTNWAPNEPGRGGRCAVMSIGKLGWWELKDCAGFRAGSVCKKEIGPHRAPDPEPDPNAPCPPGWDSRPSLHYCYKVFHEERLSRKRSWEEAERFCEALGAHLPSFSEPDEFRVLHGIMRDQISSDRFFWVGLNRRNPIFDEGSPWEWSDGRPVSTFLLHNIREDDEYNRDCLAFKVVKWRHHRGFFFSLLHSYSEAYLATPFNCDAQLEWVCQIPRGSTPQMPAWFNPHGHHESSIFVDGTEFWFVNDTRLSNEEAELYCSGNGSKLAEPRSSSAVGQILTQLAQLSSGRTSWWVNIRDMRSLYPWPMTGMHHYHNYNLRFLGRCPALSTSMMPDYSYSCEQRLPFVCEKINATSVEKDPRPHPKGLPCKEGELAFKDKCYMVGKKRYLPFSKASEQCAKDGGTLLTISSQVEQDFISSLSDQPNKSWIGLRFKHNELEWVDNSPITFNNFHSLLHGQQRTLLINIFDLENAAPCVFMYHDPNPAMMGSWDFSSCQDTQYVSVCQRYADKPEEPWIPKGRFHVKEHTYKILQENMTWFMARSKCANEDMDLASISDIYQQVNLSVTTSRFNGPLWIGFFSEDDGIHYRWTDHTHTVFSRWSPEPTSGRCVYLDTDGFWKATDCEDELPGAICHVPRDDHAELPPEHVNVKCPHKANGPTWIPFRSHCYTFQLAASRWDSFVKRNVRETCKNVDPDAEILTIRNEAENEFVRQQLQHFKDLVDYVWIGVFNDSADNKLKWYDGTYVQYSNWKDGRPNVTDSFMAGLNKEGLWELVKNQRYYARFRQLTIIACKLDYDSKEDFSKNVDDYKEYRNLNYSVIQERLTWYEALRKCGSTGGHLASIHDVQQDAHLELLAKIDGFPLWIGLSSQDDRGSPREWSDGTAFNYEPGAYTHSDPEGSCIVVNTRGAWERKNCSSVQDGAICYHSTTPRSSPQSSPASSDCPQGTGTSKWIQFKDHCYAFDMTFYNYSVYTMEDAKAVCGRLHTSSQLLTIKDHDENNFVSRYVREDPLITSRVWLGLDLDKKDNPRWVDGSTLVFKNWDASSAKDTELNCAAMISANDGVWSRVSCSQSRSRIVCKAPVRSRGTSVAVAFFLITVVTLLAAAVFVLYKKNRSRFTSTIRYQRNFDECDTTSIINDTE